MSVTLPKRRTMFSHMKVIFVKVIASIWKIFRFIFSFFSEMKRSTSESSTEEVISSLTKVIVTRRAMSSVYADFVENFQHEIVLGRLLSKGLISFFLKKRIGHCSDYLKAQQLLLDHFCNQDTDMLWKLVDLLRESGKQDRLPVHSALADALEKSLNREELRYTDYKDRASQKIVQLLQTSLKQVTQAETKTSTSWSVHMHRPISIPKRCKLSYPLNPKVHKDLVLGMWKLGSSDVGKTNQVLQRIMFSSLPVDLRILIRLGLVYASVENAPLFHEALRWCKMTDCKNSLILECRLHYLLALCYRYTPDKHRSKDQFWEHLRTSLQISEQLPEEFTTALAQMVYATELLNENKSKLKCSNSQDEALFRIIEEVNRFSCKACEISSRLPAWMEPFSIVVKLEKLKLDMEIATLFNKRGERIAAQVMCYSVASHLAFMERPEIFDQMLKRQRKSYDVLKSTVCYLQDKNKS